MNERLKPILALALLSLAVGCAPQEARFSFSEQSDELIVEARDAVRQVLLDNFGTPQEIIAWQALPVDYGTIEGEVLEPAEGRELAPHQFQARLTPPDGGEDLLLRADLSGLSLVWTSGEYAEEGMFVETPEGDLRPIDLHVTGFDPVYGVVSTDAQLEPAPGDRFVLVGHVMQDGRRLYMQHCSHCHGTSGDGAGPTAKYLDPLPRDYRPGVFKFTSTHSGMRPARADLEQIVRQGIPGTYMPSFLLLADDELHAIVEYVRWLSMRGQLEQQLVRTLATDYSEAAVASRVEGGESREEIAAELEDYLADLPDLVESTAEQVAAQWTQSEEETSIVRPEIPRPVNNPEDAEARERYLASVARGRRLYFSERGNCVACHGASGRGDGPQTVDFVVRPEGGYYPEPGLFDEWGHKIKPRDLTKGVYRGGRRPVDVYRRVAAGIKGTPMPASTVLQPEEIWDIVNYVMSMPYHGPDGLVDDRPADNGQTRRTAAAR